MVTDFMACVVLQFVIRGIFITFSLVKVLVRSAMPGIVLTVYSGSRKIWLLNSNVSWIHPLPSTLAGFPHQAVESLYLILCICPVILAQVTWIVCWYVQSVVCALNIPLLTSNLRLYGSIIKGSKISLGYPHVVIKGEADAAWKIPLCWNCTILQFQCI